MQSLDPVSFHEDNIHSFNLYAYGNNNPYRYEDPDGEVAIGFSTETAPAAGESFAALAAYTVGYVRGDAFLMQVALDGMYERRSENISAIFAPVVPKTGKALQATTEIRKDITKSSLKRVKRLVEGLSDNRRQDNGLSQEKTDQLRRIVETAGGRLRNDGASGVKGSSAGKPHVQTEGMGKSIDSRHVWTKEGVK